MDHVPILTKVRGTSRNPAEPVLTRRQWLAIDGYSVAIATAVVTAFAIALGPLALEPKAAVSILLLTLIFSRLWHLFNVRDAESGVFRKEITANPFVWGALGLCTGLGLIAVCVPGLAAVLGVVPPAPAGWGLILVMSLAPLVVVQGLRLLQRKWSVKT